VTKIKPIAALRGPAIQLIWIGKVDVLLLNEKSKK